jgi:hypothetical protein
MSFWNWSWLDDEDDSRTVALETVVVDNQEKIKVLTQEVMLLHGEVANLKNRIDSKVVVPKRVSTKTKRVAAT